MFVELYSIVGRRNVLSYGELRTATENYSSNNLLGEGGYVSVYKVSPSVAHMDMNLLNFTSESSFSKLRTAKGCAHFCDFFFVMQNRLALLATIFWVV